MEVKQNLDSNNNTMQSIGNIVDNLISNIEDNLKIEDRPTFYIDEKPIRAAGILFYVKDKSNNKNMMLFRRENKETTQFYCDTGGKTDVSDESSIETAIRETVEETNSHIFDKKHNRKKCTNILKNIFEKQKIDYIYSPKSKYILYLVELRYSAYKKPLSRLGSYEKSLNDETKTHTYFWLDTIPIENLHPRLKVISKKIQSFFNKIKCN